MNYRWLYCCRSGRLSGNPGGSHRLAGKGKTCHGKDSHGIKLLALNWPQMCPRTAEIIGQLLHLLLCQREIQKLHGGKYCSGSVLKWLCEMVCCQVACHDISHNWHPPCFPSLFCDHCQNKSLWFILYTIQAAEQLIVICKQSW